MDPHLAIQIEADKNKSVLLGYDLAPVKHKHYSLYSPDYFINNQI